jgi:DNA ligase-1
VSGQTEGKKVTSAPTICKPKNLGRSNETSAEKQAELEARAKWQKKIDEGYIEDVDALDGAGAGRVNPMLAKSYDDYCDELTFPLYSQPKLDGLRMIVTRYGAYSRLWKPFVTVNHIREALQSLFDKHPEIKAFDGEIYNHHYKDNFEKIVSLTKKTKPTAKDIEDAEDMLEFHIYDYVSETPDSFDSRITKLRSLFNGFRRNCLNPVRSTLCYNQQDLDSEYEHVLEAGYEGQMIRNPKSPYQHKRTKDLLKRKEFTDSEFEIVGYNEGEGNRQGCIILKLIAPETGKLFDSVPTGSLEYQRSLWNNREKLLGQRATVKYQGLTQEGIPRFNNTIKIRNKLNEEIVL